MADGSPMLKFSDPHTTAKGDKRAWVPLKKLETLWLNTGTLCNIACENCYIESTPTNDALVYLTRDEAYVYLEEAQEFGTREIGITGGEPFMNPDILGMMEDALSMGYELLVLTNAMKPMMRPRLQEGLLALPEEWRERLTLRVSMDHYSEEHHDAERGEGAYRIALEGIKWLNDNGFNLAVAGRSIWGEPDEVARDGYGKMLSDIGIELDVSDPRKLVIFAEMRAKDDPPEITTECWGILNKSPDDIMCSTSRMVVKRKGAGHPVVLSCTLLAYDDRFVMGRTLKEAKKPVSLNHKWCATFCVLGGSSCS